MEALSALKRLQELLKEGAQPFAARVMLEIASPDVAEQARADDSRAATSLLREIQEAAELIKAEVIAQIAPCKLSADHFRIERQTLDWRNLYGGKGLTLTFVS